MTTKPKFHLFIPNLLKPLEGWHQDFLFEAKAPYLEELFSQFTVKVTSHISSLNTAFFNAVGLQELPIAYYRYQTQLGEKKPGLMCADPVHLEVAMNDVTLTHKITDLSDSEAQELIELLNEYFIDDGLQFIFGSNQSWYVTLAKNECLETRDIESVLLQNIVGIYPKSNLRNWQIIQNEVQMLLHGSEINQQREMAGLKSVNSLWFWGAGHPEKYNLSLKANSIISRDGLSAKLRGKTFATAVGCEWQALPKMSFPLINEATNSSAIQIIILDQLFSPAIHNHLSGFQEHLSIIDKNYIKPLLDAWKQNDIDLVIDCCDGQVIAPLRCPVWKFWVKPTKLRDVTP